MQRVTNRPAAPKLFRSRCAAALAKSPCEGSHPETPAEILEMAWWLRHGGMCRAVDIAEIWNVPSYVVRAWLAEYAVRRVLGRRYGVRELARKVRHAHRPWRLARWREDDGTTVVFALDTADCPHCPDCGGSGYWRTGSSGDDLDVHRCPRCAQPLAEVRIPDRLYRLIPGAPLVFVPYKSTGHVDNDPPF